MLNYFTKKVAHKYFPLFNYKQCLMFKTCIIIICHEINCKRGLNKCKNNKLLEFFFVN